MITKKLAAAIFIFTVWGQILAAQTTAPTLGLVSFSTTTTLPLSGAPATPYSIFPAGAAPDFLATPESSPIESTPQPSAGGVQTKRIAGVVPNFQAVSADVVLPPLSLKQKFVLADQSTFDYSSFAFVGLQAEIEEATNTYPEFHRGEAGFARYYWHTFADQAVGNYITGAILPSLTHEDPRYYTLYHGSFLHRTVYAFSRLWITRNDAGKETFNISEMAGVGLATGVSGFYYPREERVGVGENCMKWAAQLLNDGISNVFEEFWPDINRKFLHEK